MERIVISEHLGTVQRAQIFIISLCWPSSERITVTQSGYVTDEEALSLNQKHEKINHNMNA